VTVVQRHSSPVCEPVSDPVTLVLPPASPPAAGSEPTLPVAEKVVPFPSLPRSTPARLDKLLAAQRWRDANLETLRLLLGAAKSQRNFCIRVDEIARIPPGTLRTVDRLWLNHSCGHFGFSVQARTLAALGGGSEYARTVWQACGDRLGWRRGRWLSYEQLDFSLHAPTGHLPRIDPLGNYYPGITYIWLLSAIARQLVADETRASWQQPASAS